MVGRDRASRTAGAWLVLPADAASGATYPLGARRVRTVHRWGAEFADLHHVPQRLIRLAQLKLEEAKLRLVKTAVEEDEAGRIVQGVAELIAGGNQLAVRPVG